LLQTDDDLRRKPDPRVHLEMGLLRLINASRLAPLEELLAEVRGAVPATGLGVGPKRSMSAASITVTPRRDATPAPSAPVPFAPVSPAPRSFPSAPAITSVPIRSERAPQPVPAPALVPAIDQVQSGSQSAEVGLLPAVSEVSTPTLVFGLTEEQVGEIKSTIEAQQRFIGGILEHSNRWELEGAELRIYFSPDGRTYAEMLEGRETLEKMRSVSSKVLGRPVRVCAKLEVVAAAAAASRGGSGTQDLRAQFERDPMVKSMLQRFGGKITEVKRNPEES
jgi:hypothetical protein